MSLNLSYFLIIMHKLGFVKKITEKISYLADVSL